MSETRDLPVWDAKAWLAEWLPVWDSHNKYDQHRMRGSYYRDHHTMEVVRTGAYISENGKTVTIPNTSAENTADAHTRAYSEEMHIEPPVNVYDTVFDVRQGDCLVVAKDVAGDGGKTAVLNLANQYTPGGGVWNGSGAQEESIFLRSNYHLYLYPWNWHIACLQNLEPAPFNLYPMDDNFGGAYTRDVTVFRGRELEGYPLLDEPWLMNFIAVAAIEYPDCVMSESGEPRIHDQLVPVAKNKIRTVLNIAADNGIENLVLGAMGCGAFHNPPKHMAELFREVFEEPAYKGRFRNVVFAITNENLVEIFRSVLISE